MGGYGMQSATFLIKPASSLCNMRCHYCFYHNISNIRTTSSMGFMSEDTAKSIIQAAFDAVESGGFVQFTFQGGEPTLAGLDFFRSFLALETQLLTKDITVGHSIQTNGLHLNDDWAEFLKRHNFLVGVSIDGNQAIHDAYRVDASGRGTWDRVTASLALLDRYGVETNILCVVSATVAKNPQKVYTSLRGLGDHPIQFIPCLDPLEAQRGTEKYSLKPDAYGKFLCGIFDCWHRDWKAGNYISIRAFDDYLRILMRMPPSTCAAFGACGSYLVVEGDGSLYPCDFYVLDEWKIGNIHEMSVPAALTSSVSVRFAREGSLRPDGCGTCRYVSICRGGCKRDWTMKHQNYYCVSFKMFFDYALPRLLEIAGAIMRN